MRKLRRQLYKLLYKHRGLLLRVGVVVLTPICALNLAVAYFGETSVFPFSPFYLQEKLSALLHYGVHRPLCFFKSDVDMAPMIAQAERRHGLPSGLLSAVIQVESATKPHRISPTGAMGPAQLMPETARELEVSDPFDPEQAVEGSAKYLSSHLRKYRNLRLAVAAYNAGPNAVVSRVPQNGETEYYVARVMSEYMKRKPISPRPPPTNEARRTVR